MWSPSAAKVTGTTCGWPCSPTVASRATRALPRSRRALASVSAGTSWRSRRRRAAAAVTSRHGGTPGRRRQGPAEDRGQGRDQLRQLPDVLIDECLVPVAHSDGGLWVHIHDDAVGTDRDGRPAQRQDKVTAAAGVGRINDHREMGKALRDAETLLPERRIAAFIQDRADAKDYRRHLGVPA